MERTLMVTQRSSLVQGLITVESKRSGLVARTLIACGFAVATLSPLSAAHASSHGKHRDQTASAQQAAVSGPKSNPDKKADAKAAREKKKAEKAAQKAEKLAKAKAGKKGDGEKVAKADSKAMNDDMGGGDDPLEGL
jgi:septal ring-binding cell division protein DamX